MSSSTSSPRVPYEPIPAEEVGLESRPVSVLSSGSSIDDLVAVNKRQLFCAAIGMILGQILSICGVIILPKFLHNLDKKMLMIIGIAATCIGFMLFALSFTVFANVQEQLGKAVRSILNERLGPTKPRLVKSNQTSASSKVSNEEIEAPAVEILLQD